MVGYVTIGKNDFELAHAPRLVGEDWRKRTPFASYSAAGVSMSSTTK